MQKVVYFGVEIDYELTPKKFYTVFLKDMQKYFRYRSYNTDEPWALHVNLAHCPNIEGTVIPNLLTVGYIVGKKTGMKPTLYIPREGEAKLWNYLNDIRFMEINENNRVYNVQVSGSSTAEGYGLADYCTTTFLKKGLKEEQISTYLSRRYSKLFRLHLGNFEYFVMGSSMPTIHTINILEVFCKQLCYNSINHGNSFCYTTMQVNYRKNLIFISVSDCGLGMYRTFYDKIVNGYKPALLTEELVEYEHTAELDFRAIIEGLIYRFNEEQYGIWSVMTEIMDMEGIIRFHSGKARVIIADLDMEKLLQCQDQQAAALYLYEHLKGEECMQSTPFYQGTHIELELPLIQ